MADDDDPPLHPMPDRLPLPPPVDGEGDTGCLEALVAADNAAWNAFVTAWTAARNDTDRALAYLAYLTAHNLAVSDYYGCCGVVPPS